MSDDVLCTFAILVAFAMGAWNGWMWRYLAAKRRLRQMRQEQEHRLHHVRAHPNGGTFPYAQPVCTCDQFDGPEGERYVPLSERSALNRLRDDVARRREQFDGSNADPPHCGGSHPTAEASGGTGTQYDGSGDA